MSANFDQTLPDGHRVEVTEIQAAEGRLGNRRVGHRRQSTGRLSRVPATAQHFWQIPDASPA